MDYLPIATGWFFFHPFKHTSVSISFDTIRKGLRVSGLCPFNVENVSFQNITTHKTIRANVTDQPIKKIKNRNFLKSFEMRIGHKKIEDFKNYLNKECAIKDKSLYLFWNSIYRKSVKYQQNEINIETISETDAPEN